MTAAREPDPGLPTVDQRRLRDVLGHFASGVTVVTALLAEGTAEGIPIGFTCQAFSSLSLQPPLVVFAPSRTSTTWPRLRAIGRFCVNVLAEDQIALSRTFAASGGDKFAGVPWTASRHGSPVLEKVAAWIDCRLWAEYDGGDHTLAVARVLDLGADHDRRPLLFHRGAYGLLSGSADGG